MAPLKIGIGGLDQPIVDGKILPNGNVILENCVEKYALEMFSKVFNFTIDLTMVKGGWSEIHRNGSFGGIT